MGYTLFLYSQLKNFLVISAVHLGKKKTFLTYLSPSAVIVFKPPGIVNVLSPQNCSITAFNLPHLLVCFA